jgi:hypothetical protein
MLKLYGPSPFDLHSYIYKIQFKSVNIFSMDLGTFRGKMLNQTQFSPKLSEYFRLQTVPLTCHSTPYVCPKRCFELITYTTSHKREGIEREKERKCTCIYVAQNFWLTQSIFLIYATSMQASKRKRRGGGGGGWETKDQNTASTSADAEDEACCINGPPL